MEYCAECTTLRDALIYRLYEYGAYLQLVIQFMHEHNQRLVDARRLSDEAARKMMIAKNALQEHRMGHLGKTTALTPDGEWSIPQHEPRTQDES
jgi:hypothetical protein